MRCAMPSCPGCKATCERGAQRLHALTTHTLWAYSARMMMSPCNAQGDLPPGVHQATLVEVVERFGQGAPERGRDGGRHGSVEVWL